MIIIIYILRNKIFFIQMYHTTCETCKKVKRENIQLKSKVTRLKNKLASNQGHWVKTFREMQEQKRLLMENTGKTNNHV